MPIFGEKELATQTDIRNHQDNCFKTHIKPIIETSKGLVLKEEYEFHKNKCSLDFQEMLSKQESLNLAVFGNKETKTIGMIDKVDEMHAVFVGSGFTLKMLARLLAIVAAVGTAFTFIYKLILFKP